MTDGPQGHGWWQASDLKWYPPEQRSDVAPLPPPPTVAADAAQQQPADSTLAATPAPQQPRKPAKTRQVIERDRLGLLTKIGQGGQGVVYRAPNVKTKFAASMVYKEYKPQTRTEIDFTALAAMPALVEESLSYAQAERLVSVAAWPCALVEEAGTPTGFVMPAIPQQFFIALATVKGVSSSSAEFQHLLNHSSVLAARGINIDDAQRCTLLRETASALAFLHKHGVCVGDISPKNLLFCLTPHEGVYFIDCDAMRINTVSALPQVETPGWNAPSGEELATIYTDTYKLGLLALRLLTGDHDTTNPGHLPATTPALLRQIITDTLTNQPHQRPLPEAWTYVLGHAIEQAQHQKKTTPPVSAPPAAPPTPIVHSRPPVGPSAPPVPQPPPAYARQPVWQQPAYLHLPATPQRPPGWAPAPPPRPGAWPPPQIGTPPPWGQRPRRRLEDSARSPWWRRRTAIITTAVSVTLVVATVIAVTIIGREPNHSATAPGPTGTPNSASAQQYPNLPKECAVLTTDILAKTVGADPRDIQSTYVGALCRWQAANPAGLIDITRFWFEQGSLDNERKVAQELKYQVESSSIAGVDSIVMRPNDPNGSCGVASDAAGVVGWWINPQAPGIDACAQAIKLMELTLATNP